MSNEWTIGTFECLNGEKGAGLPLSIMTCIVPCLTYGKTAEKLGDDCMQCGLFACFCGMMSSGIQRYQIKSKYNIDGGKFLPLDVIFLWLFGCCSTVQHSAEVTSREGGGSA